MSFHKRFYNWELILEYANREDFQFFNKWLIGPDAQIFGDEISGDFFKAYCYLDKDSRYILFESISLENKEFYTELIKCINVVFNDDNKLDHENNVKSYVNLFVSKWKNMDEKYIKIVTKK